MESKPQQPVRRPNPDPSSLGPLKNTQLVTQREDFNLQ
jgi:hypothetical protein